MNFWSQLFISSLLLCACTAGKTAVSPTSQIIVPGSVENMNISSTILHKLRTINEDWTVPEDEITWNPVLVVNALMKILCAANIPANYPNPFNCNQFIMCGSGSPYLWECPAGGSYLPYADMCVYSGIPGNQCPWASVWSGEGETAPTCEYIGQRPWYSPLTMPVEPKVPCGSKIMYCQDFKKIGEGECQEGYGYSKVLNGCLPLEVCMASDQYFGL